MEKVRLIDTLDGIRLTSRYSAFKECGFTWQQAFFQVLQWKNTWDLAFSTTINASSNHEAYLEIVLYEADRADQTIEWLNGLGYQDIHSEKVKIAALETDDYDLEYAYFD